MSLSDLASLGSLVSGLAVTVTLVLLLLQMRQANRYQQASMQLGRAARSQSSSLRATNPEIVRVTVKAMNCDESMTEEETRLYLNSVAADFQSLEDSFLQNRAGLLERASMETDERLLRVFFTSPAIRAMWQLLSISFSEEFRAYVDNIMGQVTPLPASELSPVYKMVLREQLAQVKHPALDPTDLHAAQASFQEAMKPGPR